MNLASLSLAKEQVTSGKPETSGQNKNQHLQQQQYDTQPAPEIDRTL
ncbi:hypothetical protein ccbrp13_23770 [Ktedonobacteria bacterium brp13]|nr:hypothetical protein ccbrp13_23770 [Ktedonobacteria bacterium brp13]